MGGGRATDAELLRRPRRSAEAFRAVYDRHAAAIHGFLLRRTRDDAVALELTAETFFLGEEAVERQILVHDLLGERSYGPSRG